jgi:hypothetical protein
MKIAAGVVLIAAIVVLATAEIRAAHLGIERPSRRESVLIASVFLVGGAAVLVRLLIALRV